MGWLIPRVKIPLPASNKATKFNTSEIVKNDQYYYHGGLVLGSVRNVLDGIN